MASDRKFSRTDRDKYTLGEKMVWGNFVKVTKKSTSYRFLKTPK